MIRSLAALALLAPALAADDLSRLPSPLDHARVGHWTEHRMTTRVHLPGGGANVYESTVRQTVVFAGDEEVRVESRYTAFGQSWTSRWSVRRGATWSDAIRAELHAEGLKVELVDGRVEAAEVTIGERTHPGRRIVARVRGEQEFVDQAGQPGVERVQFDLVILATDDVPVTGRVRTEMVIRVTGSPLPTSREVVSQLTGSGD